MQGRPMQNEAEQALSPDEIDAKYPKPDLGYRCEFQPYEHDAIRACNDAHGFAIVKGLIDIKLVEELKASIREALNADDDMPEGGTRADLAFVENSKPLRKLLEHETYLALYRAVVRSEALTIHRSAALLKMPGAGPVGWHSDHSPNPDGPPLDTNDVLNQIDDRPNGFWFYLNGTRPHRAGLAVIADSHTRDWPGPEGFELAAGGKTFNRPGIDGRYEDFDVPGLVPLYTDPGDLIIFAARTQHAAFPHRGDEPRYSCAIGFRPGRNPWPTPWELPEQAKRFIDDLPPHLHHFVEHYTSIVPGWKPDDAQTVKAEM